MAYNSAYTGSQVDAAVGAVRQKETKWDNKQDELTGTEDQLVGFNSAGEATAVAKPAAVDIGAMPAVSGGTAGQVLTKTEAGQEWQDAPDGLPEGGTEGQVLAKTATGAQWDDVPSDIPEGGTQGQVLTKGDGETVEWSDPASGLPDGGTPGQMLYQGESGPEWGDKPVMYVHITESGGTYSADKTYEEIYAAHERGDIVLCEIVGRCILQSSECSSDGAYFYAFYGSINDTIAYDTVTISPDEVIVDLSNTVAAANIPFTRKQTGLSANYVQEAIEELNDKLPAISLASATLYSGSWTLSGGKYAQTVQISGVTASARLILPDPDTPGDDQRADDEVLQAWGAGPAKIAPSAGNGTVTFYSWTQPTINIPIQVVVIT